MPRNALVKEVNRVVNSVIGKIPTRDINRFNDLVYVTAMLVTKMLGGKLGKRGVRTDLWWKRS